MTDIWRVTDWHLPIAIRPVYEGLLSALVGADFGAAVREGVDAVTSGARRLYLFETGPGRDDDLRYHHCEPGIAALLPVYSERYKPLDPIVALYAATPAVGDLAVQRVRPSDIASAGFRRRFFDEPGIVERISVLQRGPRGWRGLNVVRHLSHGPCSDGELDAIAGLARLALPMLPLIAANRPSVGELTATRLEERFAVRCPALTPRERQVCARAALGSSVEATALELGIGKTSVVTFRQRAYRRLGVTSPYELFRLVAN